MQSEQIDQLATALSKAQGLMKSAAKSKENPFFKSRYADLPAVWEACRDALSKNGLAVIQTPQFEGESTWLETTLVHSSGQWMRSRYPVKPAKNDPQGVGSAITYCRRYALMAMVGVVADEDDDGEAAVGRANGNGNGHAKAPEPAKRPVGAKTDDAAKQWAEKAAAAVRGLETPSALRKWEQANEEGIGKLKVLDRGLWADLNELLEERHTTLNSPLSA
jgi:hypothetical protein